MIEALHSINAFPVSPSEQTISISLADLQQIINEAIQPLQVRIESLEEALNSQRAESAVLRLKIVSLEKDRDTLSENQLIQLRLIHGLREDANKPTDLEKERVEKIEKLCIEAPKHEISLSELRGRMGIDKAVLSRLLKRIDRDKFYLRKSTLDKRIRYLCLRPEGR
jgi:DNA-binding MarR family transcriptional regulator